MTEQRANVGGNGHVNRAGDAGSLSNPTAAISPDGVSGHGQSPSATFASDPTSANKKDRQPVCVGLAVVRGDR